MTRREVSEHGIEDTGVIVFEDEPVVQIGDVTSESIPWWKKLWKWFVGVIKPIVKVVFSGVTDTVSYIINDAENQALAVSAIKQVAEQGLKGKTAFAAALAIIKAGKINLSATTFILAGKLPTNILETLVQLVYTCIKNKLKK